MNDLGARPVAGWIAVIVGLSGNLLEVLNAATILQEPPGSEIRPMGQAAYLFAFAGITAIIAFPLAIAAIRDKRQSKIGFLGLFLGLSPFFVGFIALHTIISAYGYTLKP